jgi:hypothetical protein
MSSDKPLQWPISERLWLIEGRLLRGHDTAETRMELVNYHIMQATHLLCIEHGRDAAASALCSLVNEHLRVVKECDDAETQQGKE